MRAQSPLTAMAIQNTYPYLIIRISTTSILYLVSISYISPHLCTLHLYNICLPRFSIYAFIVTYIRVKIFQSIQKQTPAPLQGPFFIYPSTSAATTTTTTPALQTQNRAFEQLLAILAYRTSTTSFTISSRAAATPIKTIRHIHLNFVAKPGASGRGGDHDGGAWPRQ